MIIGSIRGYAIRGIISSVVAWRLVTIDGVMLVRVVATFSIGFSRFFSGLRRCRMRASGEGGKAHATCAYGPCA